LPLIREGATEKVPKFAIALMSVFNKKLYLLTAKCVFKCCRKVKEMKNIFKIFFVFECVLFTLSELSTVNLSLYYITMHCSIA
jgi:hypothetical protein